MDVTLDFNKIDNRWEILFTAGDKCVGYFIPSKYNENEDLIKLMVSCFKMALRAYDDLERKDRKTC